MLKQIKLHSSLISIIVLISLLTGCSTQASPTKIQPGAANTVPTMTLVPDAGALKGVILVEKDGKFVPLKNSDLYLPYILISPSGITGVAGLDVTTAPRTATDENGAFSFNNIKPGKYGLLLYLVTHAYLLSETDQDRSMIIVVDANKTTDLGVLKYKTFPVTPVP